jgi:hypothetical protein
MSGSGGLPPGNRVLPYHATPGLSRIIQIEETGTLRLFNVGDEERGPGVGDLGVGASK